MTNKRFPYLYGVVVVVVDDDDVIPAPIETGLRARGHRAMVFIRH
jgi:hypothetical protein